MVEETKSTPDISISDVLSKAWEIFNKYLPSWAGLALLYIVPSVLFALVLGRIFDVDESNIANLGTEDVFSVLGGALLVTLVVSIYQLVISAVFIRVYIKAASGTKLTGFKQAFDLGKKDVGPIIVAMLVVGLIVALGAVFLVVPGVIAAFLLAATVYIVADTNKSLGEAMRLSVNYAKQFFVPILLLFLVFIGISLAAGIITGIFSSLPSEIYSIINNTVSGAIQIYGGIAAAVLYLEIKKRYKATS